MATDQIIKCATCGKDFVWSVQEQELYASRNYQPPKHCRTCRAKRRERRDRITKHASSAATSTVKILSPSKKVWSEVICDNCGKETRVPFVPNPQKPVYCKECLEEIRSQKR